MCAATGVADDAVACLDFVALGQLAGAALTVGDGDVARGEVHAAGIGHGGMGKGGRNCREQQAA